MTGAIDDPFGIYQQPATVQPAPTPGGNLSFVLVCALVAIASIFAWERFAPDDWSFDREHQEQNDGDKDSDKDRKEQDDKENRKPAIDGGYLFFIHERMLPTTAQANLLDEVAAWCSENPAFGYRSYDDEAAAESDQLRPILDYAESKNITPPMMVVKDSTGKLRAAKAWPASLDAVKELLR